MQFISTDCVQLNQFYKKNKDKARAKPGDLMFAALNDHGQICAALRLLPYPGFFFLRSVFTHPQQRGKGIASTLIQHAINTQINSAQGLPIYTLPTESAFPLYQRLGFTSIKQAQIPAELLASYRRFKQSSKGPTVMVLQP